MKISGYWRQPKKCDSDTDSYSTTEIPKIFSTVAASLWYVYSCSGKYFKGDPSQ
jgi:hypothetical protein